MASGARVVVLFEYGSCNGGEHSLASLVEPLLRLGVSLGAVAPAPSPLADLLASLQVPVFPMNGPPDSESLQTRLNAVQAAFSFDIVHANSLSMSRRLGRVAGQLRQPCVGHLRDILGLSARAVQDLNNNSRLLAVSHAAREHHIAQGVDPAKCQVLYNGVNLDRFAPRRDRTLARRMAIDESAEVVLTVGQIGMRKGLIVAMDVITRLLSSGRDVHWLVAGSRHSQKQEAIEYERALQARALQAPLAGRVHWLGVRNDIADLMATADMLLHAARQEPLGRALLEACACGLPIVCTDVGGTREIFVDGENALLCPADDAAALAQAAEQVLGSPVRRRELGDAARARAELVFDANVAAAGLVRHYASLLV